MGICTDNILLLYYYYLHEFNINYYRPNHEIDLKYFVKSKLRNFNQ